MPKKKASPKSDGGSKKNSLVKNINNRKKSGKSRSKKRSTVSQKAYKEMQNNWGKGK